MRTRARYNARVRDVLKQRPYQPNDLQAKPASFIPVLIPAIRYCAIEDQLFPGTWRAEPISYTGRGFVYLFLGPDARFDALAFVKSKNAGF